MLYQIFWHPRKDEEELPPKSGECDLTARHEFEPAQPNSRAKSPAQDISEDYVNDASENRSEFEVENKEEPLTEDSLALKTETVVEESKYANDASRADDSNAMCTGDSVKKEQDIISESNHESNLDPYDFSDQDSPKRGNPEVGLVNSNYIDVKMEQGAGVGDDEHEDFDVDDKTWDSNMIYP